MLTPEDMDDIRWLLRDLPDSYPGAELWLERRLAAVAGGAEWGTIARAEGGSVVGVVLTVAKADGRLKVSTLFVDPAHRGRGHGRRLLDGALAAAGERQVYITASARALTELDPLLTGAGFGLVGVARHRYGNGRHEFVYGRPGVSR